MREIGDLKGRRFGRLIALERVESGPGGHVQWLCQCECGTQKVLRASHLTSGGVRSCACWRPAIKQFFQDQKPHLTLGAERKEHETR
jgi:hypothetical protein